MTLPSGMVTFLFTDIEGSSARWDQPRDAMEAAVGLHDSLLDTAIGAHRGHVVKKLGDGFLAGRTFEPDEGIDWTIRRLGVEREDLAD